MSRARNTLFLIYRYEKPYYRHIKSIQHVVLLLSNCDIFTSPSFLSMNSSSMMIIKSSLSKEMIIQLSDRIIGRRFASIKDAETSSLKNQSRLASNALLRSLTSMPRMGLCSESYRNTESKNFGYARKSNTWSQRCDDLSVRCGFIKSCTKDRQRSNEPIRYS